MAGNPAITQIFRLLYNKTQIDFSNYKSSTMNRRIQRRVIMHKLTGWKEYISFLNNNPGEIDALQNDLLIHVTYFFRDPKKIAVFQKIVFSAIVQGKSSNTPVRIWVPGCSTGEEAYSFAIALTECLEKKHLQIPIQIFATDVKESLIAKARAGLYPKSIADYVSPNRLRDFFTELTDGYLINKQIRDTCVFAVHDVMRNPPFSNLDFISCQNVLIYLHPKLQKKILSLFHYALSPTGFLMLGNSEGVGAERQLFHTIDSKQKIYSKNIVPSPTA